MSDLAVRTWQSERPHLLFGYRQERDGYRPDDVAFAFGVLCRDVVEMCERHGVHPQGAIEVAVHEGLFTGEKTLAWRLYLDA